MEAPLLLPLLPDKYRSSYWKCMRLCSPRLDSSLLFIAPAATAASCYTYLSGYWDKAEVGGMVRETERQSVGRGAGAGQSTLLWIDFSATVCVCVCVYSTFLMLIAVQLMPDHLEGFLCIAKCDLSMYYVISLGGSRGNTIVASGVSIWLAHKLLYFCLLASKPAQQAAGCVGRDAKIDD